MEHVRTIIREFSTRTPAVLVVEARSGAVIVDGHAGDSVRIEAALHLWSDEPGDADDDARLVAQGIRQEGSSVVIDAPPLSQNQGGWGLLHFGVRGSRVDYQIGVPRETAVRITARSGRVHVAKTQGPVNCDVRSGRCQVEDVQGDVTIVSRSGTVVIEGMEGALSAEARSGRVKVQRVRGSAKLEAKSGSIEAEGVAGDLRATARTGAISIEDAGGKVEVRSRCGPVRYRGRVNGDFDIEVHTGPIMLAVDPDQPFFIDAESHIGPVRSELSPRRGGPQPAAGGPKVRLRTHTGPITLTRA